MPVLRKRASLGPARRKLWQKRLNTHPKELYYNWLHGVHVTVKKLEVRYDTFFSEVNAW